MQMLLSNLVLVLAVGFYNRFLPGYWTVAALLMIALSPHLIVANSFMLTETLFSLILVLSCWLLSLLIIQPSLSLAAVSGIALGIAALTRPGIQYFPFVLAVLLAVHFGRKKGIYLVAVLLFGYLMVLSPWVIRNLRTIGSISDDTLKINFLHHGMYPDFKYSGLEKSYGYPYRYDPRSSEISKSTASVLSEIARRFRDEPATHLKWYLIKKPIFFWYWDNIQGFGDAFLYPIHRTPYQSNSLFKWTHRVMRYLHWPLVVFCGAGCLMVWLPWIKSKYSEKALLTARIVSALLLYFMVIHVIGAPFPRYSIPLRPFLYGMALFGLHAFYILVNTRKANI
jgi:hypothetical protein